MSGVYALMDTLLPFEWLHYTFMKNALIAIVLLTPLFGMLGTMAVDNKMAFFSDALGHSALTGIAIGVVLGWQSQMSAMLLFGLIWAVLITFVKHHSKMSADTIISVFSSTSIALGLVVLSRGGAFAKYSSVLVGDVLSVAQGDLLALLLPEGEKELYVVLVTHRGDETLGDIIGSWGLHLIRGENGAISVSLAELPAAEDISVDGTTDEIRQLRKELQRVQELLSRSYTKAELLRMQNDKLREIQEADTSIKMAELDLRKKQTEASDGSVYSQLDGVVKAVRTPTDAAANNEAVVEVSAGGGYYVTGTVSELQLDTVKVGQTVTISSRMNGSTCTGEIVEISTYPADNASSWGGGNTNVSYYPFKVFISEDQQLQEGESVSISYQAVSDSDGNSLYLENMYVRTENGKSYVMVRGENGRLEQRWVQTGKVVWDSYTQIRGGLTQEDYVAFPYGRDVVSGAKTEESTVAVQYGG